ncbi:MAG: ribonuclease HII [Bacillota bacterium]
MNNRYPDFDEMTIKEIKQYLQTEDPAEDLIQKLAGDSRAGVIKISQQLAKKLQKKREIIEKWHKNNKYEKNLRDIGYKLIAGIDEAGRGPLAGPVVASAVILDPDKPIYGLDDSKKLSEEQRNRFFKEIKEKASVGIGKADNTEIDKLNIRNATFLAMKRAVDDLDIEPDYVLVDGNAAVPELNKDQKTIIDGDSKVNAISAASIIAKVTRDRIIVSLGKKYPKYSFETNKGYGTAEHIEALKKFGPTPIHRRSFKRV